MQAMNEEPEPIVREMADVRMQMGRTIASDEYSGWEVIERTLRAEILQDMDVSEVRAELVRIESFGYDGDDFLVGRVRLEVDTELRQGRTWDWHFQLKYVRGVCFYVEHGLVIRSDGW